MISALTGIGLCLRERFEHVEFLGREIERSSVAACRARDLVKLGSGRAQGTALGSGLTAGEPADTEDEQGMERFGELVVGAERGPATRSVGALAAVRMRISPDRRCR